MFAVVEHGADVEGVAVEKQANVAAFRGRSSFLWIELRELAQWLSGPPLRLAQHSINADGSFQACCSRPGHVAVVVFNRTRWLSLLCGETGRQNEKRE